MVLQHHEIKIARLLAGIPARVYVQMSASIYRYNQTEFATHKNKKPLTPKQIFRMANFVDMSSEERISYRMAVEEFYRRGTPRKRGKRTHK